MQVSESSSVQPFSPEIQLKVIIFIFDTDLITDLQINSGKKDLCMLQAILSNKGLRTSFIEPEVDLAVFSLPKYQKRQKKGGSLIFRFDTLNTKIVADEDKKQTSQIKTFFDKLIL